MILTPLQKLPNNVEDLGKLIGAKGLKKLPKFQKIAQSGHTVGLLVLKYKPIWSSNSSYLVEYLLVHQPTFKYP